MWVDKPWTEVETVPGTALSMSEIVSPVTVGAMRRRAAAVVAELGAPEATVDAIRLCVSEALANAAMHGYPEQPGLVEVDVDVAEDGFVVTVRDYGRGLGGPTTGHAQSGGMGLEIIRTLTERYRIMSESGAGTEIRMRFARGHDGSEPLAPQPL